MIPSHRCAADTRRSDGHAVTALRGALTPPCIPPAGFRRNPPGARCRLSAARGSGPPRAPQGGERRAGSQRVDAEHPPRARRPPCARARDASAVLPPAVRLPRPPSLASRRRTSSALPPGRSPCVEQHPSEDRSDVMLPASFGKKPARQKRPTTALQQQRRRRR